LLEAAVLGVGLFDGVGVALGLLVFCEGAVDAGEKGVVALALAAGDDQVLRILSIGRLRCDLRADMGSSQAAGRYAAGNRGDAQELHRVQHLR
jgi:hypothetical protein